MKRFVFKKKDECSSVEEVVKRNLGDYWFQKLDEQQEPFIYNMDKAISLLKSKKDQVIHIVGDYDCDGICGTSILKLGLEKAGFTVTTRLPLRFSEGYGLSEKIINEISDGVVLTVDNGIAANKAISIAKEKGLTVIVTDHHLPPEILPPADVIVDPSAETNSEFHDYCGAAVAYRLVKALIPDEKELLTDLMILASIATVADVMPLVGPNHRLVKEGLFAINHGKGVPGLRALVEKLELGTHINEEDYGFRLGPIFNASSRLYDDGASRVLEVLVDPDFSWKAETLIETNEQRKEIQKEQTLIALQKITDARPIVVYDESFGDGIIGLIAGDFCERFKTPVVVFTKAEDGSLKGSGRSIPEVHLKEVLDSIQDKILKYGGHAGAAGLSIESSMLDTFTEAFTEACGSLPKESNKVEYDLMVTVDQIPDLLEELERFAPYGEGNPKIRFFVRRVEIGEYKEIGNKTSFYAKTKDKKLKILAFDQAKKYAALVYPKRIQAVGFLSKTYYKEYVNQQLFILEFEGTI